MEIVGHSLLEQKARSRWLQPTWGRMLEGVIDKLLEVQCGCLLTQWGLETPSVLIVGKTSPLSWILLPGSSASFSCEDWRKIPLCLWQVEGQISILKIPGHSVLFNRDCPQGKLFCKASMTRARSTLLQPLLVLNVGDRKHPRQAPVKDWDLIIGLYKFPSPTPCDFLR